MSSSSEIPDYFQTVMPYLILEEVEPFLIFFKKVFNEEERAKYTDENNRILHYGIVIGDGTIVAGENTEQWKPQTAALYITVDSADEILKKALQAGATPVMELSDQDYGRSCGVLDPSGNTWWITSKLKAHMV